MTEPPGGGFQAGGRDSKTGMTYEASLAALFEPAAGARFFRHLPQSIEALAAEMARLSYCDFEAASGENLTGALARVGFSLIAEPYDDGNTQAFLAASSSARLLAFRGSDDLKAWQTNLRSRPVPWSGPGRAHDGFAAAFEEAWPSIGHRIDREDSRPLVITGHSLGGALAVLAGLRSPGSLIYSFGAPRVGDRRLAAALNREADRFHRYTNYRDPVTLLPPGLLGYRHGGTAYHIAKTGSVGALPAPRSRGRIGSMDQLLGKILKAWNSRKQGLRNDLTDHAIINYVSALR